VSFSSLVSRPEDQTYTVHPGSLAGTSCTFELLSPRRSKTIPYAYLQMIDTQDEHLIFLRYVFADVELVTNRTFTAKRQFLDDLANFRVSTIRETSQMRIRIRLEAGTEKSEEF
jgi:hypothetical protein